MKGFFSSTTNSATYKKKPNKTVLAITFSLRNWETIGVWAHLYDINSTTLPVTLLRRCWRDVFPRGHVHIICRHYFPVEVQHAHKKNRLHSFKKIENNKNNTLLRWGAIINAVYTSRSWKKALHSSSTFLVFPTCCRSEEALFVLR